MTDSANDELKEMVYRYRLGILPEDVRVTCVPLRKSAYGGWENALSPHQASPGMNMDWFREETEPIKVGDIPVKREMVRLYEILTGPRTLYAGYGPKSKVLLIGKMEEGR